MSSMFSTPGPTSSMTFLNSSSVQLFGTLPMNSLCLVSDSEHLKFLPCSDKRYQKILPSHNNLTKGQQIFIKHHDYLEFFGMQLFNGLLRNLFCFKCYESITLGITSVLIFHQSYLKSKNPY
jgi:hypothetical protein